MEILVIKGQITEQEVDAIVHPANSYMSFGGGLAKAIHDAAGDEVKQEAQKFVPVPVGKAVITKGGKLPAKHIIHAPTMEQGSSPTTVERVKLATQAILDCAERNNVQSVAIPGLGTGVGKVPKDQAAETMVKTIIEHNSTALKKVILIDINDELVEEFQKAVKKFSLS